MPESSIDLRQAKKELRAVMGARRAEAFAKNPSAPIALRDRFLKEINLPSSGIISAYHAMGSEMSPTPPLDALRQRGYTTALPCISGKGQPLIFRIYKPGDTLIPGIMDIREPAQTASAVLPDILLVPLLAFDRQMRRLGYGGGYYDRTLTMLRAQKPIMAIGIGFACQEVPQVPAGINDAYLDKIVTETQVFNRVNEQLT